MIFDLCNRLYKKNLIIKMDFEKCETCDVSITLMTSCVGDVTEKCVKMLWVPSLFQV